jgi:hypothetical protein
MDAPFVMDELIAEGDVAEKTEPLGADCADVEPNEFDAVTVTERVASASAGASMAYVCPVAPGIAAQFKPLLSQRLHWFV